MVDRKEQRSLFYKRRNWIDRSEEGGSLFDRAETKVCAHQTSSKPGEYDRVRSHLRLSSERTRGLQA